MVEQAVGITSSLPTYPCDNCSFYLLNASKIRSCLKKNVDGIFASIVSRLIWSINVY